MTLESPPEQDPKPKGWIRGRLAAIWRPSEGRVLTANFLLLAGGGFGVLLWLYHFTEWYPILISAGGLVAWTAALVQLIEEEDRISLQKAFGRLFRHHGFYRVIGICLVVFSVAVVPTCSSIRVTTLENVPREVQISKAEAAGSGKAGGTAGGNAVIHQTPGLNTSEEARRVHRHPLKPLSVHNFPVVTGWLGKTSYRVKVSGYPSLWVDVGRRRKDLHIPSSFFERPLVLLRPEAEATWRIENEKLEIHVKVEGADPPLSLEGSREYQGESVWLGVESDVQPPPRVVNRWRSEIEAEMKFYREKGQMYSSNQSGAVAFDAIDYIGRWSHPRVIAPHLKLQSGQRIEIFLSHPNKGKGYSLKCFHTLQEGNLETFPQEIILDLDWRGSDGSPFEPSTEEVNIPCRQYY